MNIIAASLRILRPEWFPRREPWLGRFFRRRPLLRIATTSSARDTGLLAELLREFTSTARCRAVVLTVGSGKALELLESDRADLALTHAPRHELDAQRRGVVGRRVPIMTNRYIIVGPAEAAAVVSGAPSAADAMRRIAASGWGFVSRADGSGTHERERELWSTAGLPPEGGKFVSRAEAGMAESLRIASRRRAFALCDRSTFLKTRHELRLEIVYQGNGDLLNAYSAVLPATGSSSLAVEFSEFLRSSRARKVIQEFRSGPSGEQLFVPAPAAV